MFPYYYKSHLYTEQKIQVISSWWIFATNFTNYPVYFPSTRSKRLGDIMYARKLIFTFAGNSK
jgi:hypothetical protein